MRRTQMIFGIILCACAGNHASVQEASVRHMAEITHTNAMLYVDPVKNDVIMQQIAGSAATFCSYRIGIADHRGSEAQQDIAKQKYFEYDMQRDWKLVLAGDSISPVFFHPMPRLNKTVREGVMVFEIPAGSVPDALVYNDATGDWGKQLIVLPTSQNYR